MAKILLTGSLGYLGTVLKSKLLLAGHDVLGFDSGYFLNNFSSTRFTDGFTYIGDLRSFPEQILAGIDVVIHLAALSNDVLGELNPGLTRAINYEATAHLAEKAKNSGVRTFIFFSTQSVYGHSPDDALVNEGSPAIPVTEYASSKLEAEKHLEKIASSAFRVLVFRPSTVCGWSPRFRSDIVLNNFAVSAVSRGVIEVKSDGTPWRPVVDIEDVCMTVEEALKHLQTLPQYVVINLGPRDGNYRVSELADVVASMVPGVCVEYTGEHIDPRSYRVDFGKLEEIFGLVLKTQLEQSASRMVKQLQSLTNLDAFIVRTTRLSALKGIPLNLE